MNVEVIPNVCGDPYLVRVEICQMWGFKLCLHVILRSDDDRAPHDHPWTFWTLMLAGGYTEHTFKGKKWIKPWTFRKCRSPYAHRLELKEAWPQHYDKEKKVLVRQAFCPAITLVLMFPKKRDWGFYTRSGWIHNKAYGYDQNC